MPMFETDEAVLARLKTLAGERLELSPEKLETLRPESNIGEGLQFDSLAQVTLLAAIEDEFGFAIEFEDREHLRTVGDLVQLIRARTTRGEA